MAVPGLSKSSPYRRRVPVTSFSWGIELCLGGSTGVGVSLVVNVTTCLPVEMCPSPECRPFLLERSPLSCLGRGPGETNTPLGS